MCASLFRLFAVCGLLLAGAALARDADEDPANGESWLLKFGRHEAPEGSLYAGTIRVTDDFGATRDRDFRLTTVGSEARGDRVVVLQRFEPACFELAAEARLIVEEFCDRLTLSYRGDEAEIAFSSLDANRRYRFLLRSDPRAPGAWVSVDPGIPAPELSLASHTGSAGVEYRWAIRARDAEYLQRGTVSAEQLRDSDLNALEASLVALGELLMNFNRVEFYADDLPREHPAYVPTPYSLWAEKPIDGGCLLPFCFGDPGGLGSAAGNPCSPASPAYNPAACPHDLTIARWPLTARPQIWKVDDQTVIGMHSVRNTGPGEFTASTSPTDRFTFTTLVPLFSLVPLVNPTLYQYGNEGDCYRYQSTTAFAVLNPGTLSIRAGALAPGMPQTIRCSGRANGRYRLYVVAEEWFDAPGYAGNNTTQSWLDWVNLR